MEDPYRPTRLIIPSHCRLAVRVVPGQLSESFRVVPGQLSESNGAAGSGQMVQLLLGSDDSIDPEDVRDELRTELVLLNGALRQLNPDLDLSDALRP